MAATEEARRPPARRPQLLLAAAVLAAAWAGTCRSDDEVLPLVAAGEPELAQPVAPPPPAAPAAAAPRATPAQRAETKPAWSELSPAQQQALQPLSASWRRLSGTHKRKWLALSENFTALPADEQQRLHSRMTEWAALSPQQRNLARLNFAEARKVAPKDKRAKWEAYQALPPEEKRKLAAAAAKPAPPPTAVVVQPEPQQKLARIPRPKKTPEPRAPAASAAAAPALPESTPPAAPRPQPVVLP